MEGDQCEGMEDIENIEQLDEVEELQTHVADISKICKNDRVTSRQSTGSTILPGETTRQSTTSLVMPCVLNVMPTGISESRPEPGLVSIEAVGARPQRSQSLAARPTQERQSLKLPGLGIAEADMGAEGVRFDKTGDKDDKIKDTRGPGKSTSYKFEAGEGGIQRTPSQNARRSFLTQDDIQQLQQLAAKQDKEWGLTRSTGGRLAFLAGEVRQKRLVLWLFLEEPWDSLRSSILSSLMVTIILASIFHSIFSRRKNGSDSESFKNEIDGWDVTFNTIFILDTAVRWWCHPLPLRFLLVPKNVIDVLSIFPFITNSVLKLPQVAGLSFLRWLRPYESFLRLLKLSRYFWGWQLLFHAILDSAKALVIPLLFLVLIVLFGSCTLYVCEALHDEAVGTAEDDSSLYERLARDWVTIRNLPDALHFSIICVLSLSTGPFYGLQAASVLSKITVVLLMLFGMLFMAMPIAIVGSCFSQTWFDQDRIVLLNKVRSRLTAQGYTPQDLQDVFDEVDEDSSGFIEFQEFKKMIKTFHLRSLNSAKCRSLFAYFDTDSDGVISFSDFALTLYPDLSLADDEDSDSDSDDGLAYNKMSSILSISTGRSSTGRGSVETSSGRPAPPIGSPVAMSVENSIKATSSGKRRESPGDSGNAPELQPADIAKFTSDASDARLDGRCGMSVTSSMHSGMQHTTMPSTSTAGENAVGTRESHSSAFGPKGSNASQCFGEKTSWSKWMQDKWNTPSSKKAAQRKADKVAKKARAALESRDNDENLPGQIDYEIALQKLEELKGSQKKASLRREFSTDLLGVDSSDLNVVNLDQSASVQDMIDIRRRLSDRSDHPTQDIPVLSMRSDNPDWSAQHDKVHLTVPNGSSATIQAAVAHLETAIHALEKRMERRIDQLISLCVNQAHGRAASAALPFAPTGLSGAQTPGGFRAPRTHSQMAHDHRSLPASRMGSRKPSMLVDSVAAHHPQTMSVQGSRRTSTGGASQITGSRRTSTGLQIGGSRRTSTGGVSQITGSRRTSTGAVHPDGPSLGSEAVPSDVSGARRASARAAAGSRRTSMQSNFRQARAGAQLHVDADSAKGRKNHHE